MKKLATLIFFLSTLTISSLASAQVGFNPEYLGNANAPKRTGFAQKIFQSYYYQNAIKAHDVETDIEAQFYTKAFTGDIKKDMFQWALHLPFGYRYQENANGQGNSVTGIGTLNAIIEYYHNIIDDGETTWWFDNGLVAGFPTATVNGGLNIHSNNSPVRIGSNSYSVTWFQENFVYHKPFMLTINPISVTYNFRDVETNLRAGLALNVLNGSAGYEINEHIYLGLDFGLILGNLLGANDGAGNSLQYNLRAYAGPAALFAFNENNSLQVCTVIDFATKRVNRGQGLFAVWWHHF